MRAVVVVIVVYSLAVAVHGGYFGLVALAWGEPWAMQMLFDLVLAWTLVSVWLVRDARTHRIPAWPYLVALPLAGSIAVLVYLLHRGWKRAHI